MKLRIENHQGDAVFAMEIPTDEDSIGVCFLTINDVSVTEDIFDRAIVMVGGGWSIKEIDDDEPSHMKEMAEAFPTPAQLKDRGKEADRIAAQMQHHVPGIDSALVARLIYDGKWHHVAKHIKDSP